MLHKWHIQLNPFRSFFPAPQKDTIGNSFGISSSGIISLGIELKNISDRILTSQNWISFKIPSKTHSYCFILTVTRNGPGIARTQENKIWFFRLAMIVFLEPFEMEHECDDSLFYMYWEHFKSQFYNLSASTTPSFVAATNCLQCFYAKTVVLFVK